MLLIFGKYNLISNEFKNKIFLLSHEVMTKLIPSSLSLEEEQKIWRNYDNNRINTNYILLLKDDFLKGFIAYRIEEVDIFLDDLIISPLYQNDGRTFAVLLNAFYNEIKFIKQDSIRVYTNKVNIRMQRLLNRIGFNLDCQTERGFKYSITKEHLYNNFKSIFKYFDERIIVDKSYFINK